MSETLSAFTVHLAMLKTGAECAAHAADMLETANGRIRIINDAVTFAKVASDMLASCVVIANTIQYQVDTSQVHPIE
jgi:hypothetical protein